MLFDSDGQGHRNFPTPFGRLTIYAYEAAGGSDLEDGGPAAMAIECLTAAAVVLDDLQDMESTPGLQLRNPGEGAELVALLLVLARRALGSLTDLHSNQVRAVYDAFSEFELDALKGQHESNQHSGQSSISLEQAATHAAAKSGSFGRIAARIGALLTTSDQDRISSLEEFGWLFGIIDQLQNDVAAVWPGADPDPDLVLGRKTLPITFALQVPSKANLALQKMWSERGVRTDVEELSIRQSVFESGAIHYTMISAEIQLARARRIARHVQLKNSRSRLEELLTP